MFAFLVVRSTPFSTGNLYYALTHSPEPLSEEYAYVLSWKAATKRLEAAGSISVDEAKAMEAANIEVSDLDFVVHRIGCGCPYTVLDLLVPLPLLIGFFIPCNVLSIAFPKIDLPPLIESEERRRQVATTIRKTRNRYRQFRSRLSDEIKQTKGE